MARNFTAAIFALLLDTGWAVTKTYSWAYTPPQYNTDPGEKCVKTEYIDLDDDGTPDGGTNTSDVPTNECCEAGIMNYHGPTSLIPNVDLTITADDPNANAVGEGQEYNLIDDSEAPTSKMEVYSLKSDWYVDFHFIGPPRKFTGVFVKSAND